MVALLINSQKVGTTQMSPINIKLCMYVCNGVLFGHKNKWNTDNMWQQG